MTVCILGNSLTALALAKALVNHEIEVHVYFNKKNYKISDSRTIGIAKNNVDFFNSNIINIKKLLWNLKRIEIFSEHLGKEKLVGFKANENQLFSIIKNYKLYKLLEKDLSKNKFFRSKFSNEKKLSFLKKYELIINCDLIKFYYKSIF